MLAPLSKTFHRILQGPAAGPVASLAAVLLAGLLAASTTHAARREAELKAQVGALAARNEQTTLFWRAQLTSCRAEAAVPAEPPQGLTKVQANGDEMAARLASHGPAGFDVCARMEAADQAVLASLHAK